MARNLDHLPNAGHIDRVIASYETYHNEWFSEWGVSERSIYHQHYPTAYAAIEAVLTELRRHSERNAVVRLVVSVRAAQTILGLVMYDDSAHLLESTPEEIQLLIALGHPYAVLFLPSAIAFREIAKLNSI